VATTPATPTRSRSGEVASGSRGHDADHGHGHRIGLDEHDGGAPSPPSPTGVLGPARYPADRDQHGCSPLLASASYRTPNPTNVFESHIQRSFRLIHACR
jgi:hypothetical protein